MRANHLPVVPALEQDRAAAPASAAPHGGVIGGWHEVIEERYGASALRGLETAGERRLRRLSRLAGYLVLATGYGAAGALLLA